MRHEEREDAEVVASATECTGLVPALHDEAEEAATRALYDVQPAQRPQKKLKAK